MLQAERPEFDGLLDTLFGGWGRTPTHGAREGFWRGCQSMSLSDFARCTESALRKLQSDSDLTLPNVGAIWSIKRGLRAQAPAQETADNWSGDRWDQLANQHLLGFILRPPLRKFDERATRILVEKKNLWAKLVREVPDMDMKDQKEIWSNCMAEALNEIGAR